MVMSRVDEIMQEVENSFGENSAHIHHQNRDCAFYDSGISEVKRLKIQRITYRRTAPYRSIDARTRNFGLDFFFCNDICVATYINDYPASNFFNLSIAYLQQNYTQLATREEKYFNKTDKRFTFVRVANDTDNYHQDNIAFYELSLIPSVLINDFLIRNEHFDNSFELKLIPLLHNYTALSSEEISGLASN